jgi:hypothetical protein
VNFGIDNVWLSQTNGAVESENKGIVFVPLLVSQRIPKMSSKSANILFDDMFTISEVDRARFERGMFSMSSTSAPDLKASI